MNTINEKLLGINIDHIATLRQQRGTRYPEPIQAALIAEQAGADLITVHLREDRRHIQDRDVDMLIDVLQTRMNLEMAATPEMLSIAKRIGPSDCCIVPERRQELTTEGGLDVIGNKNYLRDFCLELKEAGIKVSLFIDADERQLDVCQEIGVPAVEIHTGHYADAKNAQKQKALLQIQQAVEYGSNLGLQINAGHGLDYHNVLPIALIQPIKEYNIGHSIISRAVISGLAAAVAEMKRLISSAENCTNPGG
ncbi:MAG: pyridoxine 5'-phosphate synthase [Sedimenticola sp.]|nr:pyridoxine 5'-phosphate synthase [Sedimenticola sp.]MCW8921367.1 pyridoxine 5'-phosphate synthase [Sedimenticola sp.]MCW8974676.1 pyridoxine 5'-phosphate synthase [Sedimenticola sp.]MDF1530444.1 pyridoxine 5'-phosphate synthase [Sedimenticola sp.]